MALRHLSASARDVRLHWCVEPWPSDNDDDDIPLDASREACGPIVLDNEALKTPATPTELPASTHDDLRWTDFGPSDIEDVVAFLAHHFLDAALPASAAASATASGDRVPHMTHTVGREYIRWTLFDSPRQVPEMFFGVRHASTGAICGVSGGTVMPMKIPYDKAWTETRRVGYGTIACVHPDYRGRGVMEAFVQEFYRRCRRHADVHIFLQTAQKLRPSIATLSETTYYIRPIRPQRLFALGMMSGLPTELAEDPTALDLYYAPAHATPHLKGWRPMQPTDVPGVRAALQRTVTQAKPVLCPYWAENADVAHWMSPRENFLYTYVRYDNKSERVQDIVSFYVIEKTIRNHPTVATLRVGYLHYSVCGATVRATQRSRSEGHRVEKKRQKQWSMWFRDLVWFARHAGLDSLNIQPGLVGDVTRLCTERCMKSNAQLHVYMHNWKSPPVTRAEDLFLAPL